MLYLPYDTRVMGCGAKQSRLAAATNGQAGELEQAAAELRDNPYDLATLYNDYAVKYQVQGT